MAINVVQRPATYWPSRLPAIFKGQRRDHITTGITNNGSGFSRVTVTGSFAADYTAGDKIYVFPRGVLTVNTVSIGGGPTTIIDCVEAFSGTAGAGYINNLTKRAGYYFTVQVVNYNSLAPVGPVMRFDVNPIDGNFSIDLASVLQSVIKPDLNLALTTAGLSGAMMKYYIDYKEYFPGGTTNTSDNSNPVTSIFGNFSIKTFPTTYTPFYVKNLPTSLIQWLMKYRKTTVEDVVPVRWDGLVGGYASFIVDPATAPSSDDTIAIWETRTLRDGTVQNPIITILTPPDLDGDGVMDYRVQGTVDDSVLSTKLQVHAATGNVAGLDLTEDWVQAFIGDGASGDGAWIKDITPKLTLSWDGGHGANAHSPLLEDRTYGPVIIGKQYDVSWIVVNNTAATDIKFELGWVNSSHVFTAKEIATLAVGSNTLVFSEVAPAGSLYFAMRMTQVTAMGVGTNRIDVTQLLIQNGIGQSTDPVSDIIMVEYPCPQNRVSLHWRNAIGGMQTWMFAGSQDVDYVIQDGRKFKRLIVFDDNLSRAQWELLQDLIGTGVVFQNSMPEFLTTLYKSDTRVNSQVYMTTPDGLVGVIVNAVDSRQKTMNEQYNFSAEILLPETRL